MQPIRLFIPLLAALSLATAPLRAAVPSDGDWPMWRHDPARTATTDASIPAPLHLQWTRHLPPQIPAWKDEGAMKFDANYEPIAHAGKLFIASTVNDSITAYDLKTGRELWRFYAGGPVRFAPVAADGVVYFGSDDGCVYALSADDGALRWSFRAGPTDRRLLGNERLISAWPIRGGPVLAAGRIYFAAGVWPFMGTFIYAMDAKTGRVLWVNDSLNFTFRERPHPNSFAFDGLSPQGYLVATGDKLIVPGSRSNPAVLDRNTGQFLFYAEGGGPLLNATQRFGFADQIFDLQTGRQVRLNHLAHPSLPILAPDAWYSGDGRYGPATLQLQPKTTTAPIGYRRPDVLAGQPGGYQSSTQPSGILKMYTGTIQKTPAPRGRPLLLAGSRLITAERDRINIYNAAESKPLLQLSIKGSAVNAIAAHDHLLVTTADATIYCFGPQQRPSVNYPLPAPRDLPPAAPHPLVDELLARTRMPDGYCLVYGLANGDLVKDLLQRTKLRVIAIDEDPQRITRLRHELSAAGQYASRAHLIIAKPDDLRIAPYMATAILTEAIERSGFGKSPASDTALLEPLRPYGGIACLPQTALTATVPGLKVERLKPSVVISRPGPLPDSADWCGQNADPGNTRCSADRLVEAPLGVLWFGNDLSNTLILPKHGEGPVEQITGGRMFVEGPDTISAADVYTGRLLWTRQFKEVGKYYSVMKHQRGAHVIGGNFYAAPDAVYVAVGETCHILNPATGETLKQLTLPPAESGQPSPWQFLLVYDDLLIAGHDPIIDSRPKPTTYESPTASRGLVVMNRHTGQVLWRRQAQYAFGHYAIVAGRGTIFCIDRLAPETIRQMQRANYPFAESPRILALDARTGKVLWESNKCVGHYLTYSRKHDLLISDGALRGQTGEILWTKSDAASSLWNGKWGLVLRGDRIITQNARSFDLLSGRQRTMTDYSGASLPWTFRHSHGCAPMAASWNLLTFRSGAAAFYDLAGDGGTANLGGFKSGCTSNLIVGDGVLAAPDYTRGCSCAYPNRSSLALVHMPEVEYWTFAAVPTPGRFGFNFGAPGDRLAPHGTLWRETPNAADQHYGGADLATITPPTARPFYHYSSRIRGGDGLPWVAASGLIGLRTAKVPLPGVTPAQLLKVKLTFVEPEDKQPGQRIFSVAVGDQRLIDNLDIAKEAQGPFRSLVKQFDSIRPTPAPRGQPPYLEFTFTPTTGEPLICGIEVLAAEPQPASAAR